VGADSRVIIKLATDFAHIHYVDIDTSHFSGNEAPESSVFGITLSEDELKLGRNVKINSKDSRWTEILPVVGLGPNSRHIFELGNEGKEGKWSALMVRMIPDGGMVCAPPEFSLTKGEIQSIWTDTTPKTLHHPSRTRGTTYRPLLRSRVGHNYRLFRC
jgi:allantoicase